MKVANIIVCGHSNCGGCSACLQPVDSLENLPHTRKWLELAGPVRDRVRKEFSQDKPEIRQQAMERANVIAQIKHLMTYPYIRELVNSGQLTLSGWHYIIETGEVFIYDQNTKKFQLANW